MPRQARKLKTSICLSRAHLKVLRQIARREKRSVSFILQEIIEEKAQLELKATNGEQQQHHATTKSKDVHLYQTSHA